MIVRRDLSADVVDEIRLRAGETIEDALRAEEPRRRRRRRRRATRNAPTKSTKHCIPHAVATEENLLNSLHANLATIPGFTPLGCRVRPCITASGVSPTVTTSPRPRVSRRVSTHHAHGIVQMTQQVRGNAQHAQPGFHLRHLSRGADRSVRDSTESARFSSSVVVAPSGAASSTSGKLSGSTACCDCVVLP